MASSSQVLESLIKIKASGDKSTFTRTGDMVEQLGQTINQVSQEIINFGKTGIEIYESYEDNMRQARVALATAYGKDTAELDRVMKDLDTAAQSWAANSSFYTEDVSNAIMEAARAGWDYEKIMAAMPKVIDLAKAGSLDLSEALDQVVKVSTAAGIEFKDLGEFIDYWVYAANSSPTSVEELGEAYMRMGSTMRWATDPAELFALGATMADFGVTSSEAGTLLRGNILRLIAPTAKAKSALDALGASEEELLEIAEELGVEVDDLTGGVLKKALDDLSAAGFKGVYDSEGRLRPILDIYQDLGGALAQIAGGWENIQTNEKSMQILAAIFPSRQITGAMNLINAAKDGYTLLERLRNGDAAGYASWASSTMLGGLRGQRQLFESKIEELQRKVGEGLAPALEEAYGFLGQIVDGLNNMPADKFASILDFLTGVAVAGPGVMLVGAGMQILGNLKWVALAAGVAAAAGGISWLIGEFTRAEYQNFVGNFGTLDADVQALSEHTDSLTTAFTNQQKAIEPWEAALEEAQTKYAASGEKLASLMLMDVLTGKELTQDDIDQINGYAQSLYDAVWTGIGQAKSSDKSFLEVIFGDHENAEQDEVYNTAGQLVDSWYGSLYKEAEDIGAELREKMTLALQDKNLDEQERQAIQATVDRYNQIMAEIQSRLDSEVYYEQLYKAQSVSWESISGFLDENETKQAEDLAKVEDAYRVLWARTRAAYEYAIEHGGTYTDAYGVERTATEEDWEAFEAQFKIEKDKARQSVIDKYGELNATAVDALMNDSDVSVYWNYLKWLTQNGGTAYDDKNGYHWEELMFTPQIAETLTKQGGDFERIIGRLRELMEPFADNPDIAGFLAMLDQAANLRSAAGKYLGYYQEYQEYGRDVWGDMPAYLRTQFEGGETAPTLTVETYVDDTAVEEYEPEPKRMRILPFVLGNTYAEGGRATVASIFGEAGPEWAIPEEHSARTADLLNAAREASGFTWPELLARTGGLNANPSNVPVTVVYSPTIHAQDARGVEAKLLEDKERLERWWEEKRLRDRLEVYA